MGWFDTKRGTTPVKRHVPEIVRRPAGPLPAGTLARPAGARPGAAVSRVGPQRPVVRPVARWRRLAWRAGMIMLPIAAVAGLAGLAILAFVALTLPETESLTHADRHPSITLLAADGSMVATYGDLVGEPVRLRDLPKALPEAVIATEDRRFYHHWGIDPIGLARATLANLRAGGTVQGGSTLTQQVAKNLFLTPDRTIIRKLQEAMLALRLEHRFSKDQILEIYLNRVYFGAGAYGVDAAARRYFGKRAGDLNVYECATLAGLLKAPSRYSPAGNRERAAARTRQVLRNMVEAGYLDEAGAAAAERQSVELATVTATESGLRYFADWVADQAAMSGYRGDIRVTTTLDPKLQRAAEAVLGAALDRDGGKANASEAALVAMTPDGAVRAMVGGRDYHQSQFNRATQASRQPGSAFKPFVYLTALEQGISPDDTMVDRPVRIGNWEPRNYTGKYLGEMTLASALANSINTVAAQLVERVGVRNVIGTARRLGITGTLPADASLALGTGEVTLLDLTSAYACFASGGLGAWPYGFTQIRDPAGASPYQRGGGGPGRLIDADTARQMNVMLNGVIDHGTGRAARIGRWAAGKTGTTSDYRDALFVGYTPDLVAGVWFGNDDDTPMNKVTGGSLPAKAWHDFMMLALKDVPAKPMPGSEGESAAASPVAPPPDAGEVSFDELLKRVQEEGEAPATGSAQP